MSNPPPPTGPPPPGAPGLPPPPPGGISTATSPPGPGRPLWRRWWVIAIAVALVLLVIGAIAAGGDDEQDAVQTAGGTTDGAVAATSDAPGTSDPPRTVAETDPPEVTDAPASDAPATTEAPPSTAAATTVAATTVPATTIPATTIPLIPGFGSGIQLVGEDVQPGLYTTAGASGFGCYFERLSGVSGELDDIIANGNATGPVIVEIAPTDVAFSSTRCEPWSAHLGGTPVDTFTDGDWAVGQQVAPGRWSTDGDPASVNCYWERSSGFGHTIDEIIANENTEGRAIVDIAPGDVRFTTSGCGSWTRIG